MKTTQDLKKYTQALLNEIEIDSNIINEFCNIQLLLYVYMLGLYKENFSAELLLKSFTLEDTPEQYHTLIAQMAIIKTKSAKADIMGFLLKDSNILLKEFKMYINK